MELDTLKTLWLKSNKTGNFLSAEDITAMLKNENKSTIKKLIRWDIFNMTLITLCIPFFWYIAHYAETHMKSESMYWLSVIYTVFCASKIIWQIYKIQYLKKTDVINLNIISLSKRIVTFKKYILYEVLIGFTWAIPFTYFAILTMWGTNKPLIAYVSISIYAVILFVLALCIYKRLYFKRIKKLQQNIDEIKEFDSDN